MALLFVMGITWIIGVLVFHEALLFVAYIFTIFVAFQVSPLQLLDTYSLTLACQGSIRDTSLHKL